MVLMAQDSRKSSKKPAQSRAPRPAAPRRRRPRTFQEFMERPFRPQPKNAPKKPRKHRPRPPELRLPLNSTGAALTRREDCPLWERVSVVFALVILAVFPLVVSSHTYDDITATKFRTYATLACLYIAACVGVGIAFPPGRDRNGVMRALPLQRLTVPQIVLLAYMLGR